MVELLKLAHKPSPRPGIGQARKVSRIAGITLRRLDFNTPRPLFYLRSSGGIFYRCCAHRGGHPHSLPLPSCPSQRLRISDLADIVVALPHHILGLRCSSGPAPELDLCGCGISTALRLLDYGQARFVVVVLPAASFALLPRFQDSVLLLIQCIRGGTQRANYVNIKP
jgi:hypothetical protein